MKTVSSKTSSFYQHPNLTFPDRGSLLNNDQFAVLHNLLRVVGFLGHYIYIYIYTEAYLRHVKEPQAEIRASEKNLSDFSRSKPEATLMTYHIKKCRKTNNNMSIKLAAL